MPIIVLITSSFGFYISSEDQTFWQGPFLMKLVRNLFYLRLTFAGQPLSKV